MIKERFSDAQREEAIRAIKEKNSAFTYEIFGEAELMPTDAYPAPPFDISKVSHPRLLINRDMIPTLRELLKKDAPSDEYSAMRELFWKYADEEGVTLFHENEKDIYGDNVARIERIMENVPGLAYVYDPANFIEVGEESKTALDALHGKVGYFHIKDVIRETHEIVPAGYGDGLIDQLVARLPKAGEWVLTLEPHLSIFAGYAQIDNTEMKNKFTFKNNSESFDAAVAALKKIIVAEGYEEKNGGFERA